LLTTRRVALAIQHESPQKIIEAAKPKVFKTPDDVHSSSGIVVGGVGNLMTKLAKCCHPAPPQSIAAYITRDRGITIHRDDCTFMLRMTEARKDRRLNAQWSEPLATGKPKP
jgi:GTP pyrophosphokinase